MSDYSLFVAWRRNAKASVKLWTDGTGKVLINNMLLVDYFPRIMDRLVRRYWPSVVAVAFLFPYNKNWTALTSIVC